MNTKHDNIFKKDIVVPEIVQLKAEESLLQIKEKGTDNMKERNIVHMENKTGKYRKIIKPMIAACACAALFIAASASGVFENLKEMNNGENYIHTTEDENLTHALSNMFTLKVYAADSPDSSANGYVTLEAGKSILVKETGLGSVLSENEDDMISYCIGTQFLCEGDNIERITYSIDNAAFQIVERPDASIITDFEEFDDTLNTGAIGGEESESGEEILSVCRLYKSFTVSYDNQSNDHTWINICNNTDLPWNFLFGEDKTLEDRVNGIDEMMKDVVITCTVHYTDDTSSDAFITVGGGIITPDVTGIPEKDKPYAGFRFCLQQ